MRFRFKLAFLTILTAFSVHSHSVEVTGDFKITQFFVSSAVNMHFRVYGIPGSVNCPGGFAYVNETDTGAKGKMSSLLVAYTAGKNVFMTVQPTDVYSNGTLYCNVVEFGVNG